MAPGGIYRKCEEPEHVLMKENMGGTAQRRIGDFLPQHPKCGSEGTCILYVMNAVSFLLWIIFLAVMFSKYSEMSKELEELRSNQALLTANDSKLETNLKVLHFNLSTQGSVVNSHLQTLGNDQKTLRSEMSKQLSDMLNGNEKILEEIYKIEDTLYKINDSKCQVCPAGWLLYHGSCYYFQLQNKPWSYAKRECELQGGHLVVINDGKEQDFISQTKPKRLYFWIGFTDMKTEGTFEWVDGSSSSYTHWYSREPNNRGDGEDCAIMTYSGYWEDHPCGNDMNWICEKLWGC